MPRADMHIVARMIAELAPHGLAPRGWFNLEAADIPRGMRGFGPGMPALLIGNHGAALWHAFRRSPEYRDCGPDPLDRWTARIIGEAIGNDDAGAVAVYPFGPAIWPFQRFAKRAMGLKPSPLGILIHPDFGLWHALRAAIVFPHLAAMPQTAHTLIHPCDSCLEKPCLSACPVDAFSDAGFKLGACRSYLDSTPSSDFDSTGPDCMDAGCAARNACPLGQEWRYEPDQLRFHMAAFKG